MRVLDTIRQASSNLGKSWDAGADAFKNFSFKNPNATSFVPKPPGIIERGFLGTLKVTVAKPLSWGLKTADVTTGFLITPIKWLASAPGVYFKAFPRFAPISVVVGSIVAIGNYFTNRRSAALQQTFEQAQQTMAAQAQPAYRLQPGEHDAVDARIAADKADNAAPETHAARTTAAAQAPQSPVAAL